MGVFEASLLSIVVPMYRRSSTAGRRSAVL